MKIAIFLIKTKHAKNVKMAMQLKMESVKRLISNFAKFSKIRIIASNVFLVMVEGYSLQLLIVLGLIKNFVRCLWISALYSKINVFLTVLFAILIISWMMIKIVKKWLIRIKSIFV